MTEITSQVKPKCIANCDAIPIKLCPVEYPVYPITNYSKLQVGLYTYHRDQAWPRSQLSALYPNVHGEQMAVLGARDAWWILHFLSVTKTSKQLNVILQNGSRIFLGSSAVVLHHASTVINCILIMWTYFVAKINPT